MSDMNGTESNNMIKWEMLFPNFKFLFFCAGVTKRLQDQGTEHMQMWRWSGKTRGPGQAAGRKKVTMEGELELAYNSLNGWRVNE